MQAVFLAGAWVIPKAGVSAAATMAGHRVTSGGGKPRGAGCVGAARLSESR